MADYVCPQCGEAHEDDPTDWSWSLPDVVWDIPGEQREACAKYNTDLCHYDGRFFFRCVLPLPFNDREGYFVWGPWVEVNQKSFNAYLQIYETDGSDSPRVPGKLANRIPGYNHSDILEVEIQFGPSDDRRGHLSRRQRQQSAG